MSLETVGGEPADGGAHHRGVLYAVDCVHGPVIATPTQEITWPKRYTLCNPLLDPHQRIWCHTPLQLVFFRFSLGSLIRPVSTSRPGDL